jgi:hypothetical protein
MIIQPNKLLAPTSRIVRFYNCSAICTEGPNIIGKLNLSGVQIQYESQFTTRMVLNPDATDQPIYYGFIGEDVTFLLLKFTYDETNPACQIEEEQYVEYYFKDNPTEIKYAGKLLLLTGNSTHRIPQIFLSNPSPTKVIVEGLVANLAQSDISYSDLDDEIVTITNLYSNNITSDKAWNYTDLVSGSTQLQIVNVDDVVQLYLNYSEIDAIERKEEDFELVISTKIDGVIVLRFLSAFEMYQGHSRIIWVLEDSPHRYLTKELPNSDLIPPVITLNSGVEPLYPGTNIYLYPVTRDPVTSGFTITPDDILNYFIDTVIDNRDGEIDKLDVALTIREVNHLETLTGITSDGNYDIIMSIADIANNQSIADYVIIIDGVPPVITFKAGIGDIFEMNIPDDLKDPTQGITPDDIILKTVDSVYDAVDGTIPNSDIDILINSYSGVTGITNVYEPGQYEITYSVSDRASNIASYDKTMIVSGLTILNSGDTYTFGSFMVAGNFQYTGESGTTATIDISGETFLVGAVGTGITYFIWDISGSTEHTFTTIDESITITVNNTVYTITFNGWGSLLFTIEKIEAAPTFSDLTFYQAYKEDSASGYTTSDIPNTGYSYSITLDDDSSSLYNIIINDVSYNRTGFTNTPVYLESFSGKTTGTTSGTSLYDYYVDRYPTFNTTTLDNILLGNIAFGELFENENDKFIFNDLISDDNLYSVVMAGNYPKGDYNFKVDLIDDNGYINTLTFIFIIN